MTLDNESHKLSDVKVEYITKYLKGTSILDVGAGYCYYSEWLANKNPLFKVTSIDQLDLQAPPRVTFIKTNLEEPIPLADAQFETILAFDIIEHVTHEQVLIQELYRLCKAGGILIGSVPHNDDKFLPAYNLTFYHRSDLTHKRYYVPSTLQKALTSAGFHVHIIDLRGGVSPQVIAEFFPPALHYVVKKSVGILRRIGLINTHKLASDIFFIATKP